MSEMNPQQKKVVVLAASLAILPTFGQVIAKHIDTVSYRHAFLIGWALLLVTILILVIVEFLKLKRSGR